MLTPKVLVVARDEIITSLLSTLVEAVGDRAVFAEANEDVVVAMRRLRPHIVLLEAEVKVARDEVAFQAVYHEAATVGAVLLLFSSSRDTQEVLELARHRGVPTFAMPIHYPAFQRMIADATTESAVRRSKSRARPTIDSEGTPG